MSVIASESKLLSDQTHTWIWDNIDQRHREPLENNPSYDIIQRAGLNVSRAWEVAAEYQSEWEGNEERRLLWFEGRAISGKSTVAACISHYLQRNNPSRKVVDIYMNRPGCYDLSDVLVTMLRQIGKTQDVLTLETLELVRCRTASHTQKMAAYVHNVLCHYEADLIVDGAEPGDPVFNFYHDLMLTKPRGLRLFVFWQHQVTTPMKNSYNPHKVDVEIPEMAVESLVNEAIGMNKALTCHKDDIIDLLQRFSGGYWAIMYPMLFELLPLTNDEAIRASILTLSTNVGQQALNSFKSWSLETAPMEDKRRSFLVLLLAWVGKTSASFIFKLAHHMAVTETQSITALHYATTPERLQAEIELVQAESCGLIISDSDGDFCLADARLTVPILTTGTMCYSQFGRQFADAYLAYHSETTEFVWVARMISWYIPQCCARFQSNSVSMRDGAKRVPEAFVNGIHLNLSQVYALKPGPNSI